MEPENPTKGASSWKQRLAAAIEHSCKTHYGAEATLPTIPWFLDQAPDAEIRDLLCRLVFAVKHDVKEFADEASTSVERLYQQIREKHRFKVATQTEAAIVSKKIRKLCNSDSGDSRATVRLSKGSGKTISVLSKSRCPPTAATNTATVFISLHHLSVEVTSQQDIVTSFTTSLRDWLSGLTLARLLAKPPIILQQDLLSQEGQAITLELRVTLVEADTLEVLIAKQQRLEDMLRMTDAEIYTARTRMEGMLRALGASEVMKVKDDGFRERGCEYCRVM